MIYFVRRSFEADENKLNHKKQLKAEINNILKSKFNLMNIDYSDNNFSYNDYGKPYLKSNPDIFFNISHCHEMAVCTICNSEVGIDVENIRTYHPRVVKRVFSAKETAILENSANKDEMFFRIWTLKESFVKAIGIGISYPMKSCEFLINENSFDVNGCDGYSFSQIILNNKFVCSLCVKSNDSLYNNQFLRLNINENSGLLKL